jgi:hypothetical protein
VTQSRSINNRILESEVLAEHAGATRHQRRLLQLILEAEAAAIWASNGHRNLAQWLSALIGISNWEANRWIVAAHALPHLPNVDRAFEEARLGIDKVVELCRFAEPETEARLVDWAERVTPASVRRKADAEVRKSLEDVKEADRCRSLQYWWIDEGRRLELQGHFPADQGVVIAKALDRMAGRLDPIQADDEAAKGGESGTDGSDAAGPWDDTLEERRADALYLLASSRIADDADADRATVVLHAPLDALVSGRPGCEIEDGPALHTKTALRLSCDCLLEVVLHNELGEVVGIGRKERKVPRWMLRQLKYRDGRCTFPGCEAKHFLHAHHIVHWSRGGSTDLDNLVLVCTFHHKLVHEYGWGVELGDPGTARWFRPGGKSYEPGRAPPEQGRLAS